MINLLHGTIKDIKDQVLVLDIGPIGFEVYVANSLLFNVNDTVNLFIHLQWNQEQGPTLFGFQTETDKQIFQLIIGCSGIGPKIALAILNQLGASAFLHAIQTDNEEMLSKVSGIGIKKAEQMIVHLRHKVKKLFELGISIDKSSVQARQQWNDIINALESLHYSRPEINKVMKYLTETCTDPAVPFEHLMRKALSFLSKPM
jgi:Holliday junction DNA helicase RuvA